jgi:hypothetical protein
MENLALISLPITQGTDIAISESSENIAQKRAYSRRINNAIEKALGETPLVETGTSFL